MANNPSWGKLRGFFESTWSSYPPWEITCQMPDSPSQPHICPLSPSALLQPCLPQPAHQHPPHVGRVWERAGVGSLSPPHLLPTGKSSAASELGE